MTYSSDPAPKLAALGAVVGRWLGRGNVQLCFAVVSCHSSSHRAVLVGWDHLPGLMLAGTAGI